MTGDKRKVDTLGEDTSGRPGFKRAAVHFDDGRSAHDSAQSTNLSTNANEALKTNASNSWRRTQHQTITPPSTPLKDYDYTSDMDMDMDIDPDPTPSPPILALQHSLNSVYERYSHFIGPLHHSGLTEARKDVMLSSSYNSVLVAGEAFVARMHEYVQDLQQAAVQQIQWRARVSSMGASREVMAATDALLSQLDEQIISIGAEAEGLMQEILLLRNHQQVSAVHSTTSML